MTKLRKKNQLSSIDVMVLSAELRNILLNGFINKIYLSKKTNMQIKINVPVSKNKSISDNTASSITTDSNEQFQEIESSIAAEDDQSPRYEHFDLIVKIGKYLFAKQKSKKEQSFTASQSGQVTQPGPFAMLLRKHLKNGRITDIYQHEFDRIIIIEIQKQKNYKLIIELFGDGNIILVSEDRIIQPLFSQSWSYRTIRAGEEFKFPPTRVNPTNIKETEFTKLITQSKNDLVRALIMELDLPGIYAEELCKLTGSDKAQKANQVAPEDCSKLFEAMNIPLNKIKTAQKGLIASSKQEGSEEIDVVPISLKLYDDEGLVYQEMEDYNTALHQFFEPSGPIKQVLESRSSTKKIEDDKEPQDRLSIEEARLIRQLDQQKTAIERFNHDIEINQNIGETIYSNYKRCEELLNEIKELRSSELKTTDEFLEHLTKVDDIVELNLHDGFVILKIESESAPEKIKLDLRKNVIENANQYYELGKQSKEKLSGAKKALISTEALMVKLKKAVKIEQKHVPRQKIAKHHWFEKYHWFITSKGNIVVAGRDAKSNDQVVKKHLKDKDRYCHADISGAASVVIKNNAEDQEISVESLEEACHFAVVFSKAWNAKVGSGTAYWVKPDQVSKTPQSGEFLARGAFVIRGKRNHVRSIKLEIALGETDYNGQFKLISGPISAIKNHSKKYVVLQPGTEKKNTTANELSKIFNVSVDDILGLLPSGEFTIIEEVGIK
jgi:predicted ribosome quality control (RQC) complex YloA/Tae2 family protein